MKTIYLDNAASTRMYQEVLQVMKPYYLEHYANPHSIHSMGKKAHQGIEKSRSTIAKILHCNKNEIVFTSGGTESINLAIKGIAFRRKRGHIITTQAEHAAVLETCKYLEGLDFVVTYLPVDEYGLVAARDVQRAIRKSTILISVMYANNEIGTIYPIKEIGKIAKKHKIPFFVDACQAGSLDLKVDTLNVDLLTLNGSKLHAGKGIGLLYKRNKIEIEPLLHGSGQEDGLRSGTENVPGIVALAKGLQLAQKNKAKTVQQQSSRRNYLIKKLLKIPDTRLNGHLKKRLPNNVNVAFKGVEAEVLLKYLDQEGIFISTGSACRANEIGVSHVLKAIKLPEEYALGSVRITLSDETRRKELDLVYEVIKEVVYNLRKI